MAEAHGVDAGQLTAEFKEAVAEYDKVMDECKRAQAAADAAVSRPLVHSLRRARP
jgi:hypothetical protein